MFKFSVITLLLFTTTFSYSQEQKSYLKNHRQGITTFVITNKFNSKQFNDDYKKYKTAHRFAMKDGAPGTFSKAFDFNSLSGDTIECLTVPVELRDVLSKVDAFFVSNYNVNDYLKSRKKRGFYPDKFHNEKDEQLKLFLKNKKIALSLVKKMFNYNEKKGTINLKTFKNRALNNSLITEIAYADLQKRGLSTLEDEYKSLLNENYLHVIIPQLKLYSHSDKNLYPNPINSGMVYGALLKLNLGDKEVQDLTNMIIGEDVSGEYNIDKDAFESYPFSFKMIRSVDPFVEATYDNTDKSMFFKDSYLAAGWLRGIIQHANLLFGEEFQKFRMISDDSPIMSQIGSKDGLLPNELFKVSEYAIDKDGNTEIKKVGYVRSKRIDVEKSEFSSFHRVSGKKPKQSMFLSKALTNNQSYWYLHFPIPKHNLHQPNLSILDGSNPSIDYRIGIGLLSYKYDRITTLYLGINPNFDIHVTESNFKYTVFQTSVGTEQEYPLTRIGNNQFRLNIGLRIPIYAAYGLYDDEGTKILESTELEGTRGDGTSIGLYTDASLIYKYHFTPWTHVFFKYGITYPLVSMIPASSDFFIDYILADQDANIVDGVNVNKIDRQHGFNISCGISMPLWKDRRKMSKHTSVNEY